MRGWVRGVALCCAAMKLRDQEIPKESTQPQNPRRPQTPAAKDSDPLVRQEYELHAPHLLDLLRQHGVEPGAVHQNVAPLRPHQQPPSAPIGGVGVPPAVEDPGRRRGPGAGQGLLRSLEL